MQIQGFEVKLDDASLAWRATKYAGIRWLPLYEGEPESKTSLAESVLQKSDDQKIHAAKTDTETRGPRESTVLIHMAPGCGYPKHRHLDVEEVLILRGGYRDEDGEHRAGAYVRYAKDSAHSPVALGDARRPEGPDNPACVLFAIARGGVSNVH